MPRRITYHGRAARIELSERDAMQAREWTQAIVATGIDARPNYASTGLPAAARYYPAYLGELAVAALLDWWNVPCEHIVATNGKSQHGPDLVADYRAIDVKTAGRPTRESFMMPEAQALDCDIYVGARIAEFAAAPVVEVLGWLPRSVVKVLPIGDFGRDLPTRHCLYAEMNPLRSLLRELNGREWALQQVP